MKSRDEEPGAQSQTTETTGRISPTPTANNPFAQAIFDARDILLPKGSGKGGQRRRTDLRNILFTITTQGEWEPQGTKNKNGLWWTKDRLATTLGIGRDQLRDHLQWLSSVGVITERRRLNASSILSTRHDVLHEITQRQRDDRAGYLMQMEEALNAGQLSENEIVPEFDPEDLEELYFKPQEATSEALSEAPPEALSEALPETHSEPLAEARAEAPAEALAEPAVDALDSPIVSSHPFGEDGLDPIF